LNNADAKELSGRCGDTLRDGETALAQLEVSAVPITGKELLSRNKIWLRRL